MDLLTKFAKHVDADYPVLADVDGSVARAYGVVNAERKNPFRWTFYIGKDGKILHVDRGVKPETAGEDVAKRLAQLGAPKRAP